MPCFPLSLVWRSLEENPLEILDENYPTETRKMGLLYSENCIVRTSTVLTDPPEWRTDGETDGRVMAYMCSALSIMLRAVARWKLFVSCGCVDIFLAAEVYADRDSSGLHRPGSTLWYRRSARISHRQYSAHNLRICRLLSRTRLPLHQSTSVRCESLSVPMTYSCNWLIWNRFRLPP